MRALLRRLACCLLIACGGTDNPVRAPSRAALTPAGAGPESPRLEWAEATFSPQPAPPPGISLPGCDGYDTTLTRVAEQVAHAQASFRGELDISEIVEQLRAAGSPQVWPRAWTMEGASLSPASVASAFAHSLREPARGVARRCGVAMAGGGSGSPSVAAVVSVDVLADLDPLPARARLGQWLRLSARVLVPSARGQVVLLGERGLPKAVPARLSEGELSAAFSLDQPGLFRVQVLVETLSGPRPVLEAWVFVDREPERGAGSIPAPGEELAREFSGSAPAALLAMINAARRSEGVAELTRDGALDRLAQEHAEALRRTRRTAHDVGYGMPAQRALAAGIPALRVGENVARARSLPRAHRALWHSPSHRGVLLDARFQAVGLGVAFDFDAPDARGAQAPTRTSEVGPAGFEEARGEVWIAELFAQQSRLEPVHGR